jgi:NDP-sugar pyrophosphorylase family protein
VIAWPPSALVLTAGSGTRLQPLTYVRAKPAVPVAGTPLVVWILRRLVEAGVRNAVLNLHHRPETIAGVVGEGRDLGLSVRYSWEQPILGSAGGPRRALPLLESDPFLLINGDTWPTVDLRALWEHHRAHAALVTMTLVANPAPERFGGVLVDEHGWVTGFTRRGDPRHSYHFMFAQVVARSVFASLPDGEPAESVGVVYPHLIRENPRAVRGFICDAPFIEIGTPADYLRVEALVAEREGLLPWRAGRRVSVASSARVTRSILWDDVVVEADATVEDCVLADGVRVPRGTRLAQSAVVRADGRRPQGPERLEGELLIAPIQRIET